MGSGLGLVRVRVRARARARVGRAPGALLVELPRDAARLPVELRRGQG